MLSIRPLKENDYDDTLVGWWSDWGWTAPMRDFLPQNGKGGLMVMDGDTPVCAGFICHQLIGILGGLDYIKQELQD
jgi:hypothetical protein